MKLLSVILGISMCGTFAFAKDISIYRCTLTSQSNYSDGSNGDGANNPSSIQDILSESNEQAELTVINMVALSKLGMNVSLVKVKNGFQLKATQTGALDYNEKYSVSCARK